MAFMLLDFVLYETYYNRYYNRFVECPMKVCMHLLLFLPTCHWTGVIVRVHIRANARTMNSSGFCCHTVTF